MSIARPVSRRDGTAMRESRLISGIDQVCVVVRDLDGALETMTTKAGIGPFKTWTLQSPWVWRTTYRGRRVRWSMRLGLAYVGGIQWEVIQPADGPTLYGDYIGRYGDGLHHLLISPRGSRHRAVARLAAHGAAHAQSAVVLKAAQVGPVPLAIPSALTPLAGARFGYADTFDDLGAYLELVSYPFGLPGRLATRLGKPDRWVPCLSQLQRAGGRRPVRGRRVRRLRRARRTRGRRNMEQAGPRRAVALLPGQPRGERSSQGPGRFRRHRARRAG